MLIGLNFDDAENIILITANILDIYTMIKDIKNTEIYLNKLLYLTDHYEKADESYHSPNAYNQIGLSATLINKLNLATKYYKKSIYVSKVQKNLRILLLSLDIISSDISPIFKLMNFYNKIGDKESLRSLLEFILEHNKA